MIIVLFRVQIVINRFIGVKLYFSFCRKRAKISESLVQLTASWLAEGAGTLANLAAQGWRFMKWTYDKISDDGADLPEVDESVLRKLVDREQEFHDFVRQQIVCMWIFMALYMFAYWIISRLKRKTEREALYAGEEDYFVYRVSVWMCSISMAVSIGSLTLLPFSVISVEMLQLYEGNYYLQWLSYSLIGSLWNYVFILSNLSLFVLLPFSYFFIESQGFSNTKTSNGITQRVYETLAICALFIVVVLCLAEIVLTIIQYPVSFLSITSLNLPLIYSCVSLSGALLLLISTPYGFAKMFSVVREFFCGANVGEQKKDEDKKQIESVNQQGNENETTSTVVESPEDVTLVNEDNRKDSDSGIESGSIEEMRIDSDGDFIDEVSEEGSSSKLRKRKRKHDYAESFAPVTRYQRKSSDIVVDKKSIIHEKDRYKYSNVNNYLNRRNRHFSDSDDFATNLEAGDFGIGLRQLRYSKIKGNSSNPCFKHYSSESPLPTTSVFSPLLSELAMGNPIFASTPIGFALNIEPTATLSPKFSERRSKSEDSLWKPEAYLSKMKKNGVFHRMGNRVRTAIRFSHNSRRGRCIRLLLSLRFPTIIAVLLVLTIIALMMVAINTLKLMFGFRSLPEYAQFIEIHTRHSFGLFGACVETLIIIYVMVTSFVGLYSLPLLRTLRPIRKDTSMTTIIINSSLVLVASSALPVIVNTLGMTTFDLLGAYSSIQWLSSFRVVLTYNLLFLLISIAFLFNQLTASMRKEILKKISQLRCRIRTDKRQNCENIIILKHEKKND